MTSSAGSGSLPSASHSRYSCAIQVELEFVGINQTSPDFVLVFITLLSLVNLYVIIYSSESKEMRPDHQVLSFPVDVQKTEVPYIVVTLKLGTLLTVPLVLTI